MNTEFSLLSRKASGGVTGGKGYNYQDAFMVSRLPELLADPCFEMVMKEGVEDVDVKFTANSHAEYVFYQVKDHHVRPSELKSIIDNFHEREKAARNVRKFVLACRGLTGMGASFRQGLETLRETRRMYDAEDNVSEDTGKNVVAKARAIGIGAPLEFLLGKVFFDTELGEMSSDKRMCDQFVGAMQRIRRFSNVDGLSLGSAYRELAHLVHLSIRKPIERDDIVRVIRKSVEQSSLRFETEGVKIRLYHWEVPSFDLSQSWDLLLDWSKHFDRKRRKVPPPSIWQELIQELLEAEKNIRLSTKSRMIVFYPRACLSAGMAVGWAFSEVRGYSFAIHQGSEIWGTDIQPAANRLIGQAEALDPTSKDLCVEFNIAANTRNKVEEFMHDTHKRFRARFSLQPDVGIGSRIDNSVALAYSYDAKRKIREEVDQNGCASIHMFYSGPLGLAVLFGRLLNAMHANLTCYEEQERGYAETCSLRCS